jgi:hypothetical protein
VKAPLQRLPARRSRCNHGGKMKPNRIEMLSGGRFVSHHELAMVYFDSRHRVIQIKLEGGALGELVEELQPEDIFTSSDWPKRSYRPQLFTVNGGDGVSVIEF